MGEKMADSYSNLRLGDIAPNFDIETTKGRINFHKWIDDSWCLFFSHPKDFTPVCTTELGFAAKHHEEFKKRHVKLIGLSIGSLANHLSWIPDINEVHNTMLDYPLIADENGEIARLYGMIHPNSNEYATVRTVFIIDPQKKIRLTMCYPSSTGRNFFEILRVIDALQLTDEYRVATPVNWNPGDECIVLANLTDQELRRLIPKSYRNLKSYLRMIPQPGPHHPFPPSSFSGGCA
jgi:alkyl hydroperoxide reductase subunit AhpC